MDENRLLLSRLDDLISKYYCGEVEGFGFLNELEVSTAHGYLKNQGIEHTFFGGYDYANRMYLYLTDDIGLYDDIIAVKITAKGSLNLTHRDYLGSLMGLGISRHCVGDIIIKDKYTVVFLKREISDFVLQNLTSVGKSNVIVSFYDGDTSAFNTEFESVEVLITSMRIDNLITSLCKCSRQKANELISNDFVFINYSCADKASKSVCTGDTVSIRGYGKYKICDVLRNTKSGRLVLSVLQYK